MRWVIVCAALLACVSRAEAQERFVVLRTAAGAEPTGLLSLTEAIETATAETRTTLPADEAAALLGQRHSREPSAITRDDFDALARESDAALEHVAFGRRRQARRAVQAILERAQGAIEALNRESRSARRVLNSCLYLVRALADAGHEEGALEQAVECARLVPDMQPAATEHPPAVRQLYERAVARVESGPHGALTVQSEPPGCPVFLNGRHLGSTPFSREQLPTGEYRIQVDCDARRPGRVHRVILAAEPREVVIDASFDTALRSTAGDLRLEYVDEPTEDARRLHDAMRFAAIVDASDVLLVSAESAEVARIDWLRAPDRVVASSRVSFGPGGGVEPSLGTALSAVLAERSVDATDAERGPVTIDPWEPPTSEGEDLMATDAPDEGADGPVDAAPGSGLRTLGWVLAGVGVAGYGVAWGLQIEWLRRDGQVDIAMPSDPDYADRIARRDALEAPTIGIAFGAAALTTAALPFLVGDDGAAWWHWALGGAGVAAAAAGIALWAQDGRCADEACTERKRTVPLGPLLVSMAVPLLALPIVALLMKSGEDARPSDLSLVPTIGPEGTGLVFEGRF